MKKALALLLAVIMALLLASCGSKDDAPAAEARQSENQTTNMAGVGEETASSATAGPSTATADGPLRKTLIVYFSPANSDTVDSVSAATPRAGNVSSVEYVAQLISANVDADVEKIVPVEVYPLPYKDTAEKARQEQNRNERPAFTLDVNPEEYDVIFVGYPIWWYRIPMIMQTFFDSYDFDGKTIIPFNLHAGSRDGGTYREIQDLEPNARVLDGLAVSGEQAGSAEKSVKDWLSSLTY